MQFRYDYQGRRIEKLVLKRDAFGAYSEWVLQTRYLYDGWNLVAEFAVVSASDSTLTRKRSYTWGLDLIGSGGVGALLQIHDYAANKTLLPSYDGSGNVVALVNAESATLELAAIYEYTSYGETMRATGSYASENPFRFSTKFTDAETGLVYYG